MKQGRFAVLKIVLSSSGRRGGSRVGKRGDRTSEERAEFMWDLSER